MKKLYKSETNRYICGVCGGIAEYFGIDATLVRLGFAVLGIMGGGILLYLAAAIIIPRQPEQPADSSGTEAYGSSGTGAPGGAGTRSAGSAGSGAPEGAGDNIGSETKADETKAEA